jgi:serpin B
MSADVKTVVRGNTDFACELYGRLAGAKGNLFFSPYSVSTALAMTYAGARGTTAEEMAKTLHLALPAEQLHAACAALLRDLHGQGKPRPFRLAIANALWGQKGYGFLPAFIDVTRANYGAGLREVDFSRAAEEARQTINYWVEEETKGKIKELVKPDVVGPQTRLVLTNAIYFKAPWQEQFAKQATRPEDFHLATGQKVPVPMMHRTGSYFHLDAGKFQLLDLPYEGNEQSMLVILPKKGQELAALEKGLTESRVQEWAAKVQSLEVRLSLPRFKITQGFQLHDVLAAMGMPSAFDPGQADFSGMDARRDLFLSRVIHKAYVDVNEEGTEAAAATAVAAKLAAAPPGEPVEFRADRPFAFIIRDRRSGSILFMGRVADPR